MSKNRHNFYRFAVAFVLAVSLTAASPPRVININAGSEVGWVPSESLEAEMVDAAMAYWQAEADGDYERSYAMHSPGLAKLLSFDEYKGQRKESAFELGPIVSRNVYKQTWTHGADYTPNRGTYLAIDFSAKYEKAQRLCGYIIVHKSTPDSPAVIMRTETTYLLDASFSDPDEAKAAWRKASAYCPNYVAE